jgi:pimeloyl-ACP methyl ester carboxylesterase
MLGGYMYRLLRIIPLFSLLFIIAPFAQSTAENYVEIDESLRIYYEQEGLGQQAIVFIPGWTMSSRIFKHQLNHFKQSKKYKAIAFDPRGQGRSSKPDIGYTYTQRGQDLARFIDSLNLNEIVFVGWSFGTLDMLSYISQYGIKKVKAVVVLDGSPRTMADNINESWAWIDKLDTGASRQSTTIAVLTNPRKFYRQFASWMLDQPTPERLDEIVEISMQTPPVVAALTNETASYANYEKTLTELEGNLPLLYFVRTEWTSVVDSWRKRNTPSAVFYHMGRHLMFWEHHNEFNQQLEVFLEKL